MMPRIANKRQQLEEARLRHQLELQSQQIEQVFEHHQLSARVAGGKVQQRAISFDLQTLATGWERLRGLKQDLVTALGSSSVQISREDGSWRLHVVRPEEPPVGLLSLLSLLEGEVRPTTAVLGLAEDGCPVLLNFNDPHVTHVLLAGQEHAGKTMLLRSLALSLALHNKQSQLQLLVIDTAERREEGETAVSLDPLNYLPHLLQNVVRTAEDADALLSFLVQEMTYRQTNRVTKPVIVVLIDNVVTLLRTGDVEQKQRLHDSLLRLAQRGAAAGIHLVLSTRRPEARELDDLRKLDLTVRLVGRVYDTHEALVATGLPKTEAEYLLGRGDFLLADSARLLRFQAAFVNDYDFHLCLSQLYAQPQPRLLAQPFMQRVGLAAEPPPERPFSLTDTGELSFTAAPPPPAKNGRSRRQRKTATPQPPAKRDDLPLPEVNLGDPLPPFQEPLAPHAVPLVAAEREPELNLDDFLPLPVTKPAPRPREVPKPVAELAKPVAEPAKPVAEPAKPVAEPAKPMAESAKPVAEAPKPMATSAKPAAESAKLVTLQVLDEMDDLLPLPTARPNGRSPMAVRKRPFITNNQLKKEQSDDGTGDVVAG